MAYRLGQSQKQGVATFSETTPTPVITLPLEETPTVSPSPILTPTPTIDEASLIKQAVLAKLGLSESQVVFAITQNTGQHAKGNIREIEAVSGGYWIAAKTESGWVVVYDGQASPTCAQIAPYNFPKDMVPECLNESGSVVTR